MSIKNINEEYEIYKSLENQVFRNAGAPNVFIKEIEDKVQIAEKLFYFYINNIEKKSSMELNVAFKRMYNGINALKKLFDIEEAA